MSNSLGFGHSYIDVLDIPFAVPVQISSFKKLKNSKYSTEFLRIYLRFAIVSNRNICEFRIDFGSFQLNGPALWSSSTTTIDPVSAVTDLRRFWGPCFLHPSVSKRNTVNWFMLSVFVCLHSYHVMTSCIAVHASSLVSEFTVERAHLIDISICQNAKV